jgi:uncharacterized protein (DUF58 family)
VRTPGLRSTGRAAAKPITPIALRRSAEEIAGRLPPLMVQADRVASTVAQGAHGRRRVGQGYTFWQFRRYQPGDPANAIDWRQSAKRQAAFVREHEWDAAQSVWLWHDASPSMAYRSSAQVPEKRERAAVLTLALASLLVRGGEQIALLGGGMAPGHGRPALNRIADQVALAAADGAADRPSLPGIEPLPRYGRLVLMGDFWSPLPDLARIVHAYAARGVHGHLVQITDPAEDTLPFRGRVRFSGLEGEGEALIGRVEMVKADYVGLMEAHRAGLADLARSVGWTLFAHRTDRSPQSALLALFRVLAEER